jgi:hypothetical protein
MTAGQNKTEEGRRVARLCIERTACSFVSGPAPGQECSPVCLFERQAKGSSSRIGRVTRFGSPHDTGSLGEKMARKRLPVSQCHGLG